MAKTFITSGTGASQTLDAIQNEKVPVYNTRADAEADMANIEEGGIVATKDTGATEKVVDVVEDGNMNPVTSNGVFDYVQTKLNFKRGSGSTLADAFDDAGIPKDSNDIYGICNYIVENLIKTSAVADNSITLHQDGVGGPTFAYVLQKLNTSYSSAFIFNYGSTNMYLFRFTSGHDYHIQILY